MRCWKCEELFLPGQRVQRIPRTQVIGIGVKSGMMGLYDDPDTAEDEDIVVHSPRCCLGLFDPETDETLYDRIVEQVRSDIHDEVAVEARDEFRSKIEQTQAMIGQGQLNFCGECLDRLPELEEEDYQVYRERLARDN